MRQSINLENVFNARELGGYRVGDGRKIKKGLILRGGSLVNATAHDLERLNSEFHVSNIFDYRSAVEVKHAPDKEVVGADNLWLPTIDEKTEKFGQLLPASAYRDLENFIYNNSSNPKVQFVASQLYVGMIFNEYSQLQYASFLQLAKKAKGAIYIHCSQGKDRTGLGAAFILSALGASRQLILDDYDISNEYYSEDVRIMSERILAKGGNEEDLKVVRTFLGANTDYFAEALDEIDAKYGSLENYVRDVLMLSDEDRDELRAKYLE